MDAIVYKDRMWPINGASKAKRIAWSRPWNQMSWSYMKMLRETNRTMRVYGVNPYVEVYQFRENVYGLFSPNCDGMADVWQYLVIGPEKAMLIDTGYGLGDTPAICDELSGGKPLLVLCTHDGPDHCLGNVRYDKVFCFEEEVEPIRAKCVPGCFDYLFDAEGNNIWLQFDREDLPQHRNYELVGVPNHTVFNLGGDHNVELVWTGGHSGGHSMFLDKKLRLLFAGDVVCSDGAICGLGGRPGFAGSKYRNIETCRNQLTLLCKRLDEFDFIFPGHFMVDIENNLLPNIIEALNAIVADPDSYDFDGGNGRYQKQVRGFGTIIYTMNGVYFPG